MAAATVLGLVGAFGSGEAPFWPRMISYWAFGFFTAVLITPVIWISRKLPWFEGRPVLRHVSIGLVTIPLIGVWIWLAMGILFMHGPKLSVLPSVLGYSVVMSVVMTTLAWLIWGRRLPPAAPAPAPTSKFMERLPFRLRDAELYAVEAEDHYLRVRTAKGSELILLRLSDALSELAGVEGAQTHRSWWVAKAGIEDIRRADGRVTLVLKDGAEAPVSRTHARTLREVGWL